VFPGTDGTFGFPPVLRAAAYEKTDPLDEKEPRFLLRRRPKGGFGAEKGPFSGKKHGRKILTTQISVDIIVKLS